MYHVVTGKAVYVSVAVVFAIGVQLAPLVVDEAQPRILPVYPARVNRPVAGTPQKTPPPESVPATEAGLTVMITSAVESAPQLAL